MRFTKMQGAGNDYIYVDCISAKPPHDPASVSRKISDRHFGVGADGLILICPSERADARMRMFNADGSEAEMCGNGIRCVAKYVYDHGIAKKPSLKIETGRGILDLDLEIAGDKVQQVRVDMGAPILEASRIPTTLPGNPPLDVPLPSFDLRVTCVSMGNPHCVSYVDEITDDLLLRVGPKVEEHPAFPRRVNVEFVKVNRRDNVTMRVWERGSGETMACGTGACAVAVAGVLTGRTERRITAHLPGGALQLHWSEKDDHVYMTGPAVEFSAAPGRIDHFLPLQSGGPLAIVPPPVSRQRLDLRPHRPRLQFWVRAALVAMAIAFVGVFAVAVMLDPYKDGKVWLEETHRQLGLPECTFKRFTGCPCPSCGMTSSFALAIRGDLWHSAQANFAGTMLALGGLAFIPWAAASALAGRLLGIRNFETVLVRGVIGFLLVLFGRWAVILAWTYFAP